MSSVVPLQVSILKKEVRVAFLFCGITAAKVCEDVVRPIFKAIMDSEYPAVPYEVINDGEVIALAGFITMSNDKVLGVAMGTSEALAYVD